MFTAHDRDNLHWLSKEIAAVQDHLDWSGSVGEFFIACDETLLSMQWLAVYICWTWSFHCERRSSRVHWLLLINVTEWQEWSDSIELCIQRNIFFRHTKCNPCFEFLIILSQHADDAQRLQNNLTSHKRWGHGSREFILLAQHWLIGFYLFGNFLLVVARTLRWRMYEIQKLQVFHD